MKKLILLIVLLIATPVGAMQLCFEWQPYQAVADELRVYKDGNVYIDSIPINTTQACADVPPNVKGCSNYWLVAVLNNLESEVLPDQVMMYCIGMKPDGTKGFIIVPIYKQNIVD